MRAPLWLSFSPKFLGQALIPPALHGRTEQVASKKFLTALTALLSSPSTPPATKRMIYLTLSPLAYDAQSSPSLSNITKTFNALLEDSKTGLRSFDNEFEETDPRWQPNGAPVDADDPLFAPEALPRRRERARMFDGIEQMRDLRRRAVEGRGWAGMLCDAVANARDEAGVGAGKRWEEMSGEEKEAEQARLEGEEGQGESERRDGLEANEVVQVRSSASTSIAFPARPLPSEAAQWEGLRRN